MTSPQASTAKQFESLWRLGGLTLSHLGRDVFEEMIANNVFGRAAELAFYFLFALFPLLLIMMTLFGLFASHRGELRYELLSDFADVLPPAAFQLLGRVASELAEHASGGKLTFGMVSALWCVSGGVTSMISSLNMAHRVRETRSWIRVRAIALGLSLLLSILLLAALFIELVGSHFVRWLGTGLRGHPGIVLAWKAIQWPAAIFFVTIACALIYHCGPNLKERRRWHWLTPGSAFGALIWLAASFAFRTYLHFFNNYSATYGSLGAVMILLAWLYVAGLAYLIGGQINAEIERAGKRGGVEQSPL
jgi:membrane protein